jgi:pyrroloquinoline quinone biosynthesis protein B
MDVRLVVLGSGQDGGSPQFGGPVRTGPARTASCVAIIADGTILLLDASPDLRTQYDTVRDATGDAAPGIDAVGITHGHMGHYAGLVHFGKEAASTDGVPLIAPSSVLGFLAANEPWASLMRAGNLVGVPTDAGTARVGPLTIDAVAVPHRAEFTTTVAFSVGIDGEPWALYLPDIDSWGAWPGAEATIRAHRVALLDATFGDPFELPGRDLSAIPHPLVTDTIERFGHLTGDRTIVLTHINHSNPIGDPGSSLAARAAAAGFIVAHDGLEIPGPVMS